MADPKRILEKFWAKHVKSLEEIFGSSNKELKDVLQTADCSYAEAVGKTIKAFQKIRGIAIKSRDEKHQRELNVLKKEAARDNPLPKVSKRKADKALLAGTSTSGKTGGNGDVVNSNSNAGGFTAVENESLKFESGPSGSQDQKGEGSPSKKIKLDLTLTPDGKNGISEIKGTERKPDLVGRGSEMSQLGNENEALRRELEEYKKENELNEKLILVLQKLCLILGDKTENAGTKFGNLKENATALLEKLQELLEEKTNNGNENTWRTGPARNGRGIPSRLNEKDGCENQPNEAAEIAPRAGCYKKGA